LTSHADVSMSAFAPQDDILTVTYISQNVIICNILS